MSQASTAVAQPRVTEEARPRTRALRQRLRLVLMAGGVVAVLAGGLGAWLQGGRYSYTDDAYIDADKLPVSTDVSGIVKEVAVHDNEFVRKGQLLFRIDPEPFQYAVDGYKAKLDSIVLTVNAMKDDYQRMLRDIAAQEDEVRLDQANLERYAALVNKGGVTKLDYDNARFKLMGDQQKLESLRYQARVQLAKLSGNPNVAPEDTPDYKNALAQLHEAERQLRHTEVRAPYDGVVTDVPKLQPGMYLAASTGAFGLVSTEHMWVTAYAKETDLTWVKPGDPVTVWVDTYPGREWHGRVVSLSPASGSQFSLLPAENSSGNWVKVVQRIPVRIEIDRKPGDPPLAAGMSVEVSIDTKHRRALRDLFTELF
ncbi:MAG: HlyD family secretion protein [Acidobacteriia bacterium]|nr:HlyD family secretion protein [Methyloceanibacter sp.]MCL6492346.1 HlyD family secretion protein [Terriglobia bacterium]